MEAGPEPIRHPVPRPISIINTLMMKKKDKRLLTRKTGHYQLEISPHFRPYAEVSLNDFRPINKKGV
jgi:hypothetical protein